jgi:hypothetical protein
MRRLKELGLGQAHDPHGGGNGRVPGARRAPTSRTRTWCHPRLVNQGARVALRSANSLGMASIGDLPSQGKVLELTLPVVACPT